MNTAKEIDIESILDEVLDEDFEIEENFYSKDIEKLLEPRNSYRRAKRMYKNKYWYVIKNTCQILIVLTVIITLL